MNPIEMFADMHFDKVVGYIMVLIVFVVLFAIIGRKNKSLRAANKGWAALVLFAGVAIWRIATF
jgi:hypothetical protein